MLCLAAGVIQAKCIMTEFPVPDCKIFVDAEIADAELMGLVAQLLFGSNGGCDGCEAGIVMNEDYDPNRRRQFPEGFIYFRYYIDLYIDDSAKIDRAEVVSNVLEGLWDWGFPAVAACDYEERLPHSGGYRSRAVPWPA